VLLTSCVVDEKVAGAGLDRSSPVLPMMAGTPQKRTHDDTRNEITILFAALDMATGKVIGKVIGAIHRRHRCAEYRKFLIRIDQTVPTDLDAHIICDNYATHKTGIIQKWLAAGELTSKLLQRGVHKSIQALEANIRAWIEPCDEDPHPYVWTKTADRSIS
jgi:hypothetical protein